MACHSDSRCECNLPQEVENLQKRFTSLQKVHRAARLQDVAQLEKQFLRTLIQLADHHVENSDASSDVASIEE